MHVSHTASAAAVALEAKVLHVSKLFNRPIHDVFSIPGGHVGYRMKAAFRLCRVGAFDAPRQFCLNDPVTKSEYALPEPSFPIAHDIINKAMPEVFDFLNEKDNSLGVHAFEAKFHCTLVSFNWCECKFFIKLMVCNNRLKN